MDDRDRDGQIDWQQLDRYVTGAGNPDERRRLEQWMDADPHRRALAAAMRTVGRTRSGDGHRPDAHRALQRVQRQLGKKGAAVAAPREVATAGGRRGVLPFNIPVEIEMVVDVKP